MVESWAPNVSRGKLCKGLAVWKCPKCLKCSKCLNGLNIFNSLRPYERIFRLSRQLFLNFFVSIACVSLCGAPGFGRSTSTQYPSRE